MSIILKTAPPATWGAQYARLLQGRNPDGTIPTAGTFLTTDSLTATVSLGQSLPAIFTPTCTWFSATNCQVSFAFSAAQSALLSIDTTYLCEVFARRGTGDPVALAAFYLPVLPAAGAQLAAAPPDLVTIPQAAQLLSMLSLQEPQLEAVPTLISAASSAIRDWCNRRFDQGMVVEEVPVIRGTIRFKRPPINWIQRIQCAPSIALSVSNSSADTAWVYAATTGDLASGLTVVGVVLNWEAVGAFNSTTVLYASLADQRISTLAAAISAVGSGWTATPDQVLGDWSVAEIFDLTPSKGAGPMDQPGALYHVYSQNVTNAQPDPDDGEGTGEYWIGRQQPISTAGRWGPGGESLFDGTGIGTGARVKATYNGGFAIIPREVQLACIELVKSQLNRLSTDLILRSEHAADYSYEINADEVKALPTHVLHGLSRYRLTNA